LDGLKPPRLPGDALPEALRHKSLEPGSKVRQHPEDDRTPEQVLSQKKTKVGQPRGSEETLTGPGGKAQLQRAKDQHEKAKAQPGRQEEDRKIHGRASRAWDCRAR